MQEPALRVQQARPEQEQERTDPHQPAREQVPVRQGLLEPERPEQTGHPQVQPELVRGLVRGLVQVQQAFPNQTDHPPDLPLAFRS